MRHIQSGLNMLDEWYDTQYRQTGDSNPEDQIVLSMAPLFGPYIEKSKTYGVCAPLKCKNMSLILAACELPYVPPQFFDIKEARHCLDGVSHYVVKIVESAASDTSSMALAPKISSALHDFKLTGDEFCLKYNKKSQAVSKKILKVHLQVLTMMLRTWPVCSTGGYRPFNEEFLFILDKYDEMQEFSQGQNIATTFTSTGNLVFHMGFVPPLFFTATQSTNHRVRRAAFRHLRQLRLIERNWSSCLAYKLAESLNAINDSPVQLQCCAYPPSAQYPIYVHEVTKDSRDTATILFSCNRCRGNGATTMLYEVDISGLQCADKVHWPLQRIMRISGYQGGIVPQPSTCDCDLGPEEEIPGVKAIWMDEIQTSHSRPDYFLETISPLSGADTLPPTSAIRNQALHVS